MGRLDEEKLPILDVMIFFLLSGILSEKKTTGIKSSEKYQVWRSRISDMFPIWTALSDVTDQNLNISVP